ncbi:MAG: hypothetical protein EON54_11245 [Alcaligenaceae bacterium]|nr:MAG: hypothetical protein EON54_11245 [Alcaligenaceae bacterium]
MTKRPSESAHRASYERLRDACDTLEERLTLGEAIRKGWPAASIEDEAKNIRAHAPIKRKRQTAIYECSRRFYISPEQKAADQAAFDAEEAADDARKAVKATRATRPTTPSKEWAPIRSACRDMYDCDALQTILDDRWCAATCRRWPANLAALLATDATV